MGSQVIIFAFGFLLCISLATDVGCASSDSSINKTLPVLPVTMTSCDSINDCRSLSDIVYGCLATIFACVWVAVHPNIPRVPDPAKKWGHWLPVWATNQLWSMLATFIGIVVPEFLLIVSSRQWANARQVARDLNNAREGLRPYRSWTTVHGFFVLMGGFHYFDGDTPLYPLSRDDVERHVEAGTLEAPLEAEIWALSKGGSFAKACALLQTLWFVAQCSARAKEKLPLTELEVLTLAYTAMTMGMYIFWWNKPLSVSRPIPIQLRLEDDLPSVLRHSQTFHPSVLQTPLFSTSQRELPSFGIADLESNPLPDSSFMMQNDADQKLTPSAEATPVMFHTANTNASDRPVYSHTAPIITRPFAHISNYSLQTYMNFFNDGSQNRKGRNEPRKRDIILGGWVVASLEVGFGCIHLLSWHAVFPSALNGVFWRASTLFIAGFGGYLLMGAVMLTLPLGRRKSMPWDESAAKIGTCMGWILWTFYGAARILMLYVCVRNLSYIPILAYSTVQWTMLLPHV